MTKLARSMKNFVFSTLGLACIVCFQNCTGFSAAPISAVTSTSSTAGLGTTAPLSPVLPSAAPTTGTPVPVATTPTGNNASQASTCPTIASLQNTMAIQSPCSTDLIVANQMAQPTVLGISISDQSAVLAPAAMPIQVAAPGMKNVELYSHGAMQVRLTQVGSSGVFTGSLDLSQEPAGPMHLIFNAWNSAPGDNGATVKLSGEMTVFISGARLAIPTPLAASGLSLKWSDRFKSLSAAACNPGTGTWPRCTNATAAGSGATWWENTPGGGDFGDAAFEHTDGAYNPFAILATGGMLRIRSQYDPKYVDPYGYGRHWYSGMLATAFGSSLPYTTNIPLMTDGYYEARILAPNASCGAPWNNNCAGGTWPAFWQLSFNTTAASGAIELDTTELYGQDPGYQQSTTHAYSPATAPAPNTGGQFIYNKDPMTDLTIDFHRFGILVQGSGTANGTVCNYIDDVKLACAPMPVFGNGGTPQWYFLVNLAMGAGWPDGTPPLSNNYDMFIDYVAAWTK